MTLIPICRNICYWSSWLLIMTICIDLKININKYIENYILNTCTIVLWDLEPGYSIPIPTDWHALLCVSRLRGPRRQQRGMGLPWAAPRPQPQAPSQSRQGAPLPRRMGWKRGLPVIVRASGSPRLWTHVSQRQVSLCVCRPHPLSVQGLIPMLQTRKQETYGKSQWCPVASFKTYHTV